MKGRCLTLRILPDNLPRWQDLGLPQPFIDLTQKHRGLGAVHRANRIR